MSPLPPPDGYPPYTPAAPPKKSRTGLATLLALCACLVPAVALIVVVAVASPQASAPTSSSPAVAGVAEPDTPGLRPADAVPIGTEVTPAKGATIKVTAAMLDGDAEMTAKEQFAKPDPGTQWVIVDLSATNSTGKPTSIDTHMKLSLLASTGIAVSPSFYPLPPNELKTSAQLQPGTTITGRLAFKVPKAEIPHVVLLAEPQFTLDQNDDQRFLSIR